MYAGEKIKDDARFKDLDGTLKFYSFHLWMRKILG